MGECSGVLIKDSVFPYFLRWRDGHKESAERYGIGLSGLLLHIHRSGINHIHL
jgi:hypothetical protein